MWFGAALATAFRRADETSDAPVLVLAGFVLRAGCWSASRLGLPPLPRTISVGCTRR